MFDDMGEILPGGRVITPHCPARVRLPARGVKREDWRRTIMHPQFVTLFIETDADDLLAPVAGVAGLQARPCD
jgi:hypothetical protein